MAAKFRQDMPPEGGYRSFNWERTFPKKILKPIYVAPFLAVVSVYGLMQVRAVKRIQMTRVFEDKDIYNALEPFLAAERDRAWLKALKKNRDLEEQIMKDVPGWVTGTWYGEPVFFTIGEKWFDPTQLEFFMHAEDHTFNREHRWRQMDGYCAPKPYDDWLPKWVHKYLW